MKAKITKLTTLVLCIVMVAIACIPMQAADVTKLTDLTKGSWYEKAVNYVVDKNIMIGTSDTTFAPHGVLTRAEATQLIAAMVGADLSQYTSSSYSDVANGKWYTAAAEWAKVTHVSDGKGDGTFGPHDQITRAELCQMISNIRNMFTLNNDFEPDPKDVDTFVDGSDIPEANKDAFQWAVDIGIISGTGNNKLSPLGTATRAEIAQIFYGVDNLHETGMLPFDTKDADKVTVAKDTAARFICWGDSLTAGYVPPDYDGIECPYPEALARISGLEALNYGVSSETAGQIAMRQGGLPVYTWPITIPASSDEEVEIYPMTADGNTAELGVFGERMQLNKGNKYYGKKGIESVTIGGVKGTLRIPDQMDNHWYFKRDTDGDEVRLTALTQIVTYAMSDQRENDILVIYSGSNDFANPDNIDYIMGLQKDMVSYANTDRYIIIGFTAQPMMPKIPELNTIMSAEYGDHFLNVQTYMLTDALADYGIVPTYQDLQDIRNGQIPESIRSDGLHGNQIYYEIIAKMVYQRAIDLGYITVD